MENFWVAQLLLIDFSKEEFSMLKMKAKSFPFGGVLLFSKNATTAEEVKSITQQLNSAFPLQPFIAMDQEGGLVNQIWEGVPLSPGNAALGMLNSIKDAKFTAAYTGLELKKLGVNMILAPVLDVNTEPENPIIGARSFGDSPHKVALLGRAMIKGYKEAKLICVAKHFPGHGDSKTDSHLVLPVIKKSLTQLWDEDIYPFQVAIKEGVHGIMSAHILYPALDSSLPATLSPRIIRHLLKYKLQFKGLVISDALNMKAISQTFSPLEAILRSFKAGIEMLILCGISLEEKIKLVEKLQKLLEQDAYLASMLFRNYIKIQKIKKKMLNIIPTLTLSEKKWEKILAKTTIWLKKQTPLSNFSGKTLCISFLRDEGIPEIVQEKLKKLIIQASNKLKIPITFGYNLADVCKIAVVITRKPSPFAIIEELKTILSDSPIIIICGNPIFSQYIPEATLQIFLPTPQLRAVEEMFKLILKESKSAT